MGKNNSAPPCCESTVHPTVALPQKLAQIIFDQKDWAFVSQETAPVKRLFIRERRSLALQWVRHTRQLATRIVIHNCCATPANHQRAVNWFKLFSNYTLLLSLCIVLFFVIRWGNPIYATKLVAWALDIVERLYHPPHTSAV
jgi:hypothetical protein